MANCMMCTKFEECPWRSDPNGYCSAYEQRAMTNADRIRMMTDEELAMYLRKVALNITPIGFYDAGKWFDWLKQEVSDG